MTGWRWRIGAAALLGPTMATLIAAPTPAATPPLTPDIAPARSQRRPAPVDIPSPPVRRQAGQDYTVREVMIPMRDGVSLFTVIIVPSGSRSAPVLLTRTPFDARGRMIRPGAMRVADLLPPSEAVFVTDGYIRVFQDVRGKHRSQGEYVVARPARGPLNASGVDHATDAYDTIDWLVAHVPESGGRVGLIGSSYDGFTAAMALLDPHPALKAVAPLNPMIDTWMGDDWFHHGAFRQITFDFISALLTTKGFGESLPRVGDDDYAGFLQAGSAGGVAQAAGLQDHPFWRKLTEHPAYDAYWQAQALDRLLAARQPTVPTLWVGALFDQEDPWGAVHGYEALERGDRRNDRNFLVLGPWRHGGMNGDGSALGPLRFDGDTARRFRTVMLKPFLDQYLKPGGPPASLPPVTAYETGANEWRALQAWPTACLQACADVAKPLYLHGGGRLSFHRPQDRAGAADHYVSDPANPVPSAVRPVSGQNPAQWQTWLVADQRFAAQRPDVLSYATPPLTSTVRVRGAPIANLYAATTGTDADWVVKVIDVHPETGRQTIVAAEIFRARYRERFDTAKPIAPGKVERYRFALPHVSHAFLPGHRIMVQVQSSWFPVYDRNPQTFVENIFLAPPQAYRAATQSIARSEAHPSAVELPLAPGP